MRGRSCTQPFLVEKQTRYPLSPRRPPSPAPLGESIAPSSAPVFALGHLPPKGKALSAGRPLPVCETTSPSPPSRWAGRYGRKTQGRRPGRKKERTPCRVLKNQSRESRGEKLSPLALFPPVSREKRGPPPGRRPTGRCAPRPRKSPAHPKGTQYRPPQKRDTPKGIPTFYSTVSWMEPVAFSACTMI